MKKFTFILMAVAALMLQSCKNTNASFGIVYDINAQGDAKGNVELTFPGGDFISNGDVAIVFDWSNDTAKFFATPGTYPTIEQALISNDEDMVKAAEAAKDWMEKSFDANSAAGDYYVHLTGYVKETLTGFAFNIDKEFTNRND